jgi:16S rRNA (adenine1518-N6/adenine1519-N6)-dimethyltransferase
MLSIPEIIKKYGILANKKLGQNFLINEEICKKIAASGGIAKEDLIVEIGGGLGSLTRFLISNLTENAKLLIIEKDVRFIPILKQEYPQNFELIMEDALKFDFANLGAFKVIANLPYNIGTELLTSWITLNNRPHTMVLMLQKEVVQRIVATPRTKDYGRLSVISQSFYNCEKLFDVSKGSFNPEPNVTSSVIKMTKKDCIFDANKLATLTEKLFSSRRKILKNALKSLNILRPEFENKRAEELEINDFLSLLKLPSKL